MRKSSTKMQARKMLFAAILSICALSSKQISIYKESMILAFEKRVKLVSFLLVATLLLLGLALPLPQCVLTKVAGSMLSRGVSSCFGPWAGLIFKVLVGGAVGGVVGNSMIGSYFTNSGSGSGSGSGSWRKYLNLSAGGDEDEIGSGSNPPAQEEPAQAEAAQEAAGTPAGEPDQPPQSPPNENSGSALESRRSLLRGRLDEIERQISSLQRGEDPGAQCDNITILQEQKLFLEGELEVEKYRGVLRTMIIRRRLELGYRLTNDELRFLFHK